MLFVIHCHSELRVAPNITHTNVSSRSIHLSWTALPTSPQNGHITGYVITYTNTETGVEESVTVDADVLEYTLVVLPYRVYVLKVAGINVAGVGPYSATERIQTLPDG